ncbi:MAG: hypothetical protein WCT02_02415 [Candidatus Paceibacterota bacterium]
MNKLSKKINYWKLAAALLIAWYFFRCAATPTFGHFIDNVDLLIHEAGHWIFMFFGEFVTFLGGSLNQILIPAIFCGYFILRRDYYSSSILLMWVGYNIVNVSFYMADAVVMKLPLLGGDSSMHDWNNLLWMTHTLQYTHLFSSIAWGIGMFVMVAGAVLAVKFSVKEEEVVRL